MKIQSRFIMYSAAILSIAALSAAPALAQKKTAKACQEEWQANKAANQANKITEKAYVAKCQAESAAAKPAVAPPAHTRLDGRLSAKPAAAKPKDARQAEYARERACGQDWKADKAAGKIHAGTKWPQYWSDCNKRKKAAGM